MQTASHYNNQLNVWLGFVEISKMKAFVELTVASSIRTGTQNLLAVSFLVSWFKSEVEGHGLSLADGRSGWDEAQHAGSGVLRQVHPHRHARWATPSPAEEAQDHSLPHQGHLTGEVRHCQ